jgi:hypothetical protein
LINGDSGNPAFIILNDQPVLLTVWTEGGAGVGTSLTAFKSDVNQIMSDLEELFSLTNGFQLTEIDLSDFQKLDE